VVSMTDRLPGSDRLFPPNDARETGELAPLESGTTPAKRTSLPTLPAAYLARLTVAQPACYHAVTAPPLLAGGRHGHRTSRPMPCLADHPVLCTCETASSNRFSARHRANKEVRRG